jgi:hypothetical protein
MAAITVDFRDGQEREVYFNVSRARAFKRIYGRSLYDVMMLSNAKLEALDPDCLCHMLAVGLHSDGKLTPDKVEELLDRFIEAGGCLDDISTPTLKAAKRFFLGDEDTRGKA